MRILERGPKIAGGADLVRIPQSDGGFYAAANLRGFPPKAGGRLGFDAGGGFVFGFDHHGGAAGGGNQYVRLQAALSGKGAGVLGPYVAAGQHTVEQPPQGVVNARLGLSRRVGQRITRFPCA